MGNIVPPPSTGVPAVVNLRGETMDFTNFWRRWFVDLAAVINKSGGTDGSVPATRLINTTAPLQGGGDLTEDRTLSVDVFTDTVAGVAPASGGGTVNFLRADGTWAAMPTTGLSVTITTAKLTAGGVNGSMTFTNGLLTAQTPAT